MSANSWACFSSIPNFCWAIRMLVASRRISQPLAKAFTRIKEPKLRRRIINLVEEIARDE
jgi:hypothetical protein